MMHLYYGDGKGKTSAAMGLALRALGHGRQVVIVQFLKDGQSGELEPLRKLGAVIFSGKAGTKFVSKMTEEERKETGKLNNENLRRATETPCDVLIFDEACAACRLGMVDEAVLYHFVAENSGKLEIILTGRQPSPWMIETADYVTEMRAERHPYERGITSREGIEY